MSDTEKKLRQALERLETTTEKIIKTRGYNQDARSLKLLQELIREQLINVNFRHPTRTIR
jgi:glycyl-tRNA synthetase beta subunit